MILVDLCLIKMWSGSSNHHSRWGAVSNTRCYENQGLSVISVGPSDKSEKLEVVVLPESTGKY